MKRDAGEETMTESKAWDSDPCLGTVVGESPDIRSIYRIIKMAGKAVHPVLIIGEPGTGKELIARAIHSASTQGTTPFRMRNCTTVRAIDLERELAGAGLGFEVPSIEQRGTLFLDQINELSIELQGVLLRALQRAESGGPDYGVRYQPPRLIAAGTRDIQLAVSEGNFRRDLYFRLNALTLRVPPLRERRRDIPLLATFFLDELSHAAEQHFQLSEGALRSLLAYEWPGNVRELINCLEHACRSVPGSIITLRDLPDEVSGRNIRTNLELSGISVIPLSEVERRTIEETLKLVAGNKPTAARLLGIGKSTLYRKLREYESGRQVQ